VKSILRFLLDDQEGAMLQEGDKTILTNIARVIAILFGIMIVLIIVAGYIAGT